MHVTQGMGVVHPYHYTSQEGEGQEVLHWGCLPTSHTGHAGSPPCRYLVAWRRDGPQKMKYAACGVL